MLLSQSYVMPQGCLKPQARDESGEVDGDVTWVGSHIFTALINEQLCILWCGGVKRLRSSNSFTLCLGQNVLLLLTAAGLVLVDLIAVQQGGC